MKLLRVSDTHSIFKSDEVVYSQSDFTPVCYHPATRNLYAEHLPSPPGARRQADAAEGASLQQSGEPTGKRRVGFASRSSCSSTEEKLDPEVEAP